MGKYYKFKDLASITVNYAMTGGILAGSFFIGGPVALAVAGIAAGALGIVSTRALKNVFKNNLVQLPGVHPDSPHLGEIVKDLYQATGIKSGDYPVYKVKPAESISGKKGGILSQELMKQIDLMRTTLNAGAHRTFGKPTVIVSEPLLKLLNNEEEKAVLAHEFVHAGGRHILFSKPQEFARNTIKFSNFIAQGIAAISAGWVGLLAGAGAQVGARGLYLIAARKAKLLQTKEKDLTLPEIVLKKRTKTAMKIFGGAAFAGAVAYFSPAYLGIYAAAKGMSVVSKLLNGALSRRHEYQADAGTVTLGADPLALVTALRKLEFVTNKSYEAAAAQDGGTMPKSGKLRKAWEKMTADHPETEKRINRLVKIARKKGASEEQIQAAAKDAIKVPQNSNLPYSTVRQAVLYKVSMN